MARRDQPYLPLYIQDFMTDEKLAECSAKATGVYIRLMCILHKSDYYGKILLKQKDKQSDNQIQNFASKIAKQMPYSESEIYTSLNELLDEKVVEIEGDFLIQKRMVRDNELSLIRSQSGSKGGKNSVKKFAQAKSKANSKAKHQANTEYENEYEIVIEYLNKTIGSNFKKSSRKTKELIVARFNEGFKVEDFKTVIDKKFNEWGSNPKMSVYLRPETLFSNKFEGYLNQIIPQNQQPFTQQGKIYETW